MCILALRLIATTYVFLFSWHLLRNDIWFDDVDPDDIEAAVGTDAADIVRSRERTRRMDQKSIESSLVKCRAFHG